MKNFCLIDNILFPKSLHPRDYQLRIIKNTLKAVEDGHKSILIESPTGSGKTSIAHAILANLKHKYKWSSGWAAMRKHLIYQAEMENIEKIGVDGVEYFSSFNSEPPKVDVLIEDEGQHSAAASSISMLNNINPKVHIALTATPFRTDRMKLCFSKVIKDAGIRALIDEGWLSKYNHYTIDKEWTPENIAHTYMNDIDKWGKTVIYFLSKVECDKCSEILNNNGIKNEVVWSQSDQESQIAAFHNNEIKVLINMMILTEGFNDPELKTVFVRPSSKGPTIQMSGRALRKHESKPYAQIVQNTRTKWPFLRTASCENKYVLSDNNWINRSKPNDFIRAATSNSIKSIASSKILLPSFLQ